MISSCSKQVNGFGFSSDQIAGAIRRKGLLSIEIEFSLACNFKCPYCYNESGTFSSLLTPGQIDDVILQAKELGAGKVIILGGEPMIYPSVHERIRFMHEQGIDIEMFTNGSHMNSENARFMFEHNVAVVLKMNSFSKDVQNAMAGRDDAYEIIQTAYQNLRQAGYPAPGKRMAVSTVICNSNINELPVIWRRMRREGIEPYFEMITPQGSASPADFRQSPPISEIHAAFEEIAQIDRNEFDNDWQPQPPLVGNTCLRHCFSCLVNASGDVMPCVGITIPLGNVKETPLKSILDKSEVLDKLRHYRTNIKGPCSTCEKSEICYGCRGSAYQLTGDYLASDPLCWRNTGKEIMTLPVDAAPFLPHKEPIRIIEKLEKKGERTGILSAVLKKENPFADSEGRIDRVVFVEIIAQAVAALEGFDMSKKDRRNHRGFLLSVKDMEIKGSAAIGDRIVVKLEKQATFGDFGSVAGSVFRGSRKIATGEFSFYKAGEQ